MCFALVPRSELGQGPIRAAQSLAADLFGAKTTFFLCNGSTVGMLAAMLAAVQVCLSTPLTLELARLALGALPICCSRGVSDGAAAK